MQKTAAKTKVAATAAGATAAAGVAESCRVAAAERWIPFDEGEQRRSLLAERNATWQMMHLSCSPPTTTNNTNFATICSNTNITTATCTPIIRSCPSTPRTIDHQTKQLFKPKDHLNIFIAPFRCDKKHENIIEDDEEGHGHEAQTLELFPLRSSNDNNDENNFSDKDEIGASANLNNNFSGSHYQFFEFLPLKN